MYNRIEEGEDKKARAQRVHELGRRIEADCNKLGPGAIRDMNSLEPIKPTPAKKSVPRKRRPKRAAGMVKPEVVAEVQAEPTPEQLAAPEITETPEPDHIPGVFIKCLVPNCWDPAPDRQLCRSCRLIYSTWLKYKKKGQPQPVVLPADMTLCFQTITKQARAIAKARDVAQAKDRVRERTKA